METVCEFCAACRPVVYCKADAAYLCLSCDAKVHLANAISNRHLRTVLCDACKYRPCSIRCLDHSMFMCHGCDNNLHNVSSQHHRRLVSCYTGCPSAKDFAAMWGFQSNEINGYAMSEHFLSASCAKCDAASSCQHKTICMKGRLQRDNSFMFRQILELEKLQLTERHDGSTLMCDDEQTNISSSVCDHPKESGENLNHGPEQFHDRIVDLNELMMDLSSSPFAQMEHLSSSSTIGDSFWQCKSPSEDNQLWYQNLPDIGVCEDLVRDDDFNIPDIDLTFRNFEELFGADQEPLRGSVGDDSGSCSSVEIDVSLGKPDNCNAIPTEQDASMALSSYSDHFAETRRDDGSHDSIRNMDSLCAVRPSFSSLSFPSRRTNRTDSHNTGLSLTTGREVSCSSPQAQNLHLSGRKNTIMMLKEKKKARPQDKQLRYASRRARNDPRRRIIGGLARTKGCGFESVNVTRSY